jgi:hypothetical protein
MSQMKRLLDDVNTRRKNFEERYGLITSLSTEEIANVIVKHPDASGRKICQLMRQLEEDKEARAIREEGRVRRDGTRAGFGD